MKIKEVELFDEIEELQYKLFIEESIEKKLDIYMDIRKKIALLKKEYEFKDVINYTHKINLSKITKEIQETTKNIKDYEKSIKENFE